MHQLKWEDFEKVEMRVGTIISAEMNSSAKKPAWLLKIDFGDLGIKKSSAQITSLYSAEVLISKQVIAVVNFPPKQIGKMMSECLVLGLVGEGNDVILLQPERSVKNGLRVF